MSDIFEETEENLRAEQWTRIARTAAPWVAGVCGLALVIALGVWGFQKYETNRALAASEVYQAGIDAGAKSDDAIAKAKFEETVKTGNPAYKAMALMQLAGLSLHQDKVDEAIQHLDEAAKASHDPRLSDLAALKAAWLVMDKGSFADIQKRLTPLAQKDRPFAALAKEALAMAKLQNGDVKGARTDLTLLSVGLDTPEGVKQRAQITLQAIDSGAAPTAKAAVALPKAALPTMPTGLPEGMSVQQ